MVGHSQGQPSHVDNDDLFSLYSRPSIQNSPDWPSVRLPSPGPSVRTLNESNVGGYRDDLSSLANFSCEGPEFSDRGSVFTADISTSPSTTRPSTPSSSSHDQYQPPLSENSGTSVRSQGGRRADKRTDQSGLPHQRDVVSSRRTIEATDQPRRSVFIDINPVSPRPSISTNAEGRNKISSEGHQPVSPNDTVMFCHTCGLRIEGMFVRALGTIFHLQCFRCIDCGDVVASKFFPIDDPNGKQQPLCERDYFRRINLICATCFEPLRGSYVTACDKKYHIEHFTCSLCPTLFGPQDSYYEHDNDVYCHFHYSTRFAIKCAGCNFAILKQFVEINRNMRDECWHPECYMIHKFWNVKVEAHRPGGITDTTEPPYVDEERQESHASLKEKQIRMEEQVYRIWTVLSAYEESSAATISDTLRHVSSGSYLEAIRMAERTVLHVEVLFATIDDLEWHFARLGVKGNSHVREPLMLCKKLVGLFLLLSHNQDTGAQRTGMTQELLTLVTGIAHYLKILIRIALTGALKLGREHGIGEALQSFLDKHHMLAVQGGSPSARRVIAGAKYDVPLAQRSASINKSTYGVTYGFHSLTPEIFGESPFLDASRDSALSNVPVPSTPSEMCVACALVVEEDCVRLGTYQRWHSKCVRCKTCGVYAASPASANAEDKALVKSGRGVGDEGVASAMSIARRPPANVDHFVWSPDSTTKSPSFGEVPTTIYCTGHAHPGCLGGFQAVSRLEQYAFVLNVALRRLHLLLKKQKVIMPTPTNATSLPSKETDPHRSSRYMARKENVRLDRKLSETTRPPKRSTIVERPSGKVTRPSHASLPEGHPWKNLPTFSTPAAIPRHGGAGKAAEQRRALPSVPTVKGRTLADIPPPVQAAQAKEQHRSAPPQNQTPYVAELTPLQLAIVRHAAVAILYRSSLRYAIDLDQLLEIVEVKRQRFWDRLFGSGNGRKKKAQWKIFGVPLELLIERDGADSLLGASETALRVPCFIDDLISAMRQMDMAFDYRKAGGISQRTSHLIWVLDRPNSVDFTSERPEDLASLLREYLRRLPDPLLTSKLRRLLFAAISLPNDEERTRLLHMLMLILPKCHRDTLEVLLVSLKWISSSGDVQGDTGTQSYPSDLASVMGPSILFPDQVMSFNSDGSAKNYLHAARAATEILKNQDQFFTVPEEFLPLLHDQEYFASSMELSGKDFMKQCETYMRIKFGGPSTESVQIRGTVAERLR